jgi:hypothetical protein
LPAPLPAGQYTIKVNFTGSPSINTIRVSARTSNSEIGFKDLSSGGSYTFTSGDTPASIVGIYASTSTAYTGTLTVSNVQLEVGSTATSFEPYVGGTPAPNPDYPQPVQTVTGLQKVIVNGKNVLDYNNNRMTNTYIRSDNGLVIGGTPGALTVWARVIKNTNYTISRDSGDRLVIAGYSNVPKVGDEGYIIYDGAEGTLTEKTFNSGDYNYIGIFIARRTPAYPTWAQIESGSTATPYEPYEGREYEVNLGNIELCKIGTYQDYIYKDGQQWYIHKEIDHETRNVTINAIADNNTATPTTVSQSGTFDIGGWDWTKYATTAANAILSSNIGTFKLDANLTGNAAARAMESGTFCQRQGTNDRIYFRNTGYAGKTGDDLKAALLANSGGANLWWHLATPTDTPITNSALIAQLDALAAAKSYNDKTYITVEATDPNLPALLKVEAGEYR